MSIYMSELLTCLELLSSVGLVIMDDVRNVYDLSHLFLSPLFLKGFSGTVPENRFNRKNLTK